MLLRSLVLLFVILCASEVCFAKDPGLMSLSADHFRDTAIIQDDPVAGVTTVSTEKGYVEHHGPLRTVWNDDYLFGIVDRKAGRKTFEIITVITYRGSQRSYLQAKLQGTGAAITVPTVHMKTNSVNCPTGECTYTDKLSVPVEEALLRQLAAHAADKPELWHFTLIDAAGNYTGELSTAEMAGLLAKADEFTGAAPPPRPAVQAKPDLGLGGLRVDATAQNPSRSGVLVTAVVPGSVADKAGIIIGDIVSELAGHPIKGPTDLQSAMTSIADSSGITFKIYRGTAEMTLTAH